MSSPAIWIILPAILALIFYLLRSRPALVHSLGIGFTLILTWLAWQMPINQAFSIGLPGVAPVKINDTMLVFGQKLILGDSSRPALILIYLGICLWFTGGYAAGVNRMFIPIGTGLGALLSASLAIKPLYYAAMILVIAALSCIPLLSPPGEKPTRGVLRFLGFQILGLPLILTADWLLTLVQMDPEMSTLLAPATVILVLGFALISAIFPFHTWIPMLAETAHPYSAAFVFFSLPSAIGFLGMNYLNLFPRLEIAGPLYSALRIAGVIMVVSSGAWAAFDRNLGRIFGYAILMQIGMGLLAITLGSEAGLDAQFATSPLEGIFIAQLLPQGIAIALWAQALSALRKKQESLDYRQIQGIARQAPLATAGLVLANFSLAGLPLLASFPGDLALWSTLSRHSLVMAFLALLGHAMLFFGGLRTLAVMVMAPEGASWQPLDRGLQPLLLASGIAMLFILGSFPQWFIPAMTRIVSVFSPLP